LNKKLLLQIKIIIIALLFWALMPFNPYGYYIFLRIVCFLAFGYLSYESYVSQKIPWLIVYLLLAILYNPIIKIYLDREIWSAINIISATIVGLSMIKKRDLKNEK